MSVWLQIEAVAATILHVQHAQLCCTAVPARLASRKVFHGWYATLAAPVSTACYTSHQPFTPCHDNTIAFEHTSQLQITQYDMLQMEHLRIQQRFMRETNKIFRCHSHLVICKLWRQHARDVHWIVWRPKSRCLGATRQRAATCNTLWCCCCHRCV